jgi:hypothetical protein
LGLTHEMPKVRSKASESESTEGERFLPEQRNTL